MLRTAPATSGLLMTLPYGNALLLTWHHIYVYITYSLTVGQQNQKNCAAWFAHKKIFQISVLFVVRPCLLCSHCSESHVSRAQDMLCFRYMWVFSEAIDTVLGLQKWQRDNKNLVAQHKPSWIGPWYLNIWSRASTNAKISDTVYGYHRLWSSSFFRKKLFITFNINMCGELEEVPLKIIKDLCKYTLRLVPLKLDWVGPVNNRPSTN